MKLNIFVFFSASIVVVRLEGSPYLCQTDEVGEICVSGPAVGAQYWGLKGLSNSTFKVQPLLPDDTPYNESLSYVRSGLLGFLGPVSRRFLLFLTLKSLTIVSFTGRFGVCMRITRRSYDCYCP